MARFASSWARFSRSVSLASAVKITAFGYLVYVFRPHQAHLLGFVVIEQYPGTSGKNHAALIRICTAAGLSEGKDHGPVKWEIRMKPPGTAGDEPDHEA